MGMTRLVYIKEQLGVVRILEECQTSLNYDEVTLSFAADISIGKNLMSNIMSTDFVSAGRKPASAPQDQLSCFTRPETGIVSQKSPVGQLWKLGSRYILNRQEFEPC